MAIPTSSSSSSYSHHQGGRSGSKHNVEIPFQGTIRPRRVDLPSFDRSHSIEGSVFAYLGIPFAQPPVGKNRWKVPQGPLPSWPEGEIRQSKWQNDPWQNFNQLTGIMAERKHHKANLDRSEDCLYLNVWVPERSEEEQDYEFPVMVWVYGGAFSVGSPALPNHDGSRLAHETRAIVVSIAYRVNSFGFLGSKALASQSLGDNPIVRTSLDVDVSSTLNFGLWDIVAGLQWVKDTISAFGGDEDNITAFGESAGSVALHMLLLSPVVPSGLFHRAILQSGTGLSTLPRTLASAQATFDVLAKELVSPGITDPQAQVDELRKIPPEQIAKTLSAFVGSRPRSEYFLGSARRSQRPARRGSVPPQDLVLEAVDQWGPIWDGVSLPQTHLDEVLNVGLPSPENLLNGQDGIMLGFTVDEGSMFNVMVCTPETLSAHIDTLAPEVGSDIKKAYNIDSIIQSRDKAAAFAACSTYTGDAQFHAPIIHLMELLAKGDSEEVYGYVFSHRPSEQLVENISSAPEVVMGMGSLHTIDIPFVFGYDGNEKHNLCSAEDYGSDLDEPFQAIPSPSVIKDKGFTAKERKLSWEMMKSWGAFARGKQPWRPLCDGIDRLQHEGNGIVQGAGRMIVRAFGDIPQLGCNSDVAKDAILDDADDKVDIPIEDVRLEELLIWQERPGGPESSSLEERVRFWTGEGARRTMLMTYGDEEITWSDELGRSS
ncbi:alpha/beta-hydrolase [Violaceomyces palustris]|uniref:Alpha/beta-hydrolase n=1 Tax=Violaceomyces palustris TaxID=1673888 RepID=A0ACD0P513_9BASI|nr:alpha/beta-hydrolase [Violaceomyces palustris]